MDFRTLSCTAGHPVSCNPCPADSGCRNRCTAGGDCADDTGGPARPSQYHRGIPRCAALDTETVTSLNAKVDIDQEEYEDVALDFYESIK